MLKSRFLGGFAAILLTFSLRAQCETTSSDESALEKPVNPDALLNKSSTEGIIIEGDKLELHIDRKLRVLGNASILRGKQSIQGDLIEYDTQNDALSVIGNTSIDVGNAKLTGPDLRMNLSDSIGEMHDASIMLTHGKTAILPGSSTSNAAPFYQYSGQLQNLPNSANTALSSNPPNKLNANEYDLSNQQNPNSALSSHLPQSRGDAKAIFFEGQDKKRLVDARYTTCAAGVEDWYIKASEIRLNDYTESGVAKNAYIEFKGVPLIYTPWISFSYNNQRKSGLLAPTFGSTSRSGFELSTPFYWNIAPNMDATLATRVLSKRGIQLQGEFRYLEENFSGIDNLEYLPNDSISNENRYYANLKHQHNFGSGWSGGYDIERVSDNQYFSDLSTRIVTTSRINLPQQFHLDYASEAWQFNALAQKYQTLDNVSFPYERLPQLTLIGNKYYGDIHTNLYTQLVNFDTNKDSPLKVTGTRFTLYPSISLPFIRPYGYVTPKIGIHHTLYSLNNIANNLESQQRTLPIFSVDSGLYFDRDVKLARSHYSQTLEPRMFYVYIPDKKQSNIPIFDTSESDLNFSSLFSENQFTGNDRVNNANQLSVALTTRLIESSTGTQRLSASVGQRYYFRDQVVSLPGANLRKNNSSDIIAGLTANLKTHLNVDAFWQYNTDNSNAVRTTIASRYSPEPGKALNLSYSYRQDSLNQFDVSGQWPLGRGWYGVGRVNYSLRDNHLIETLAGVEYDAGCWQTRTVIQRVSPATANANYALFFQLELGGLASIGSNPLNLIRRSIPGYVNSNLIPANYKQPGYQ